MSATNLTAETFDSFVSNPEKPVLVDFWASWCGPCRMLGPIIDEIAEEYADSIAVAKVNVDEQPQLAARFKVMSIPTLAVFKNGELKTITAGAKQKSAIIDMVNQA